MGKQFFNRISALQALFKAGAVGALGFVVWLIGGIEIVDKALKALEPALPKSYAIGMLIALSAVAFLFYLVQALTQRSRLKQPDRFLITKDNPDHLKGREEEVADLRRITAAHALVFLEGESGCGKSALARVGLRQWREGEATRPLPIYCDLSGAPWNAGLDAVLAKAVYEDGREAMKLDKPLPPEEVFAHLAQCEADLARTPLLIFDQFDDYQSAHREHFYPQGKGALVDMVTFLAGNAFWCRIGEGVRAGQWHVLLITRDDSRAGLDVLRYSEPRNYHLSRVPRRLIEPLLDAITHAEPPDQPVIEYPDKGWNSLREVLLDDLKSDQDEVLPVQLALALKGLRELDHLTLGEYRRAGGLAGLSRKMIEAELREAARAGKFGPDDVLRLLQTLIDEERGKTRRAGEEELIRRLLDREPGAAIAAADMQRARAVLARLRDRKVLRSGADASDVHPGEWLLYHDHLALGVREAQRARQGWAATLADHARRHRRAVTMGEHWRTLLPAGVQFRLFWETLRGRLHWREQRRYGWLSSLRVVVPGVLVGLLVWGGWEGNEYRLDQAAAANLITALDSSDGVSSDEGHYLRVLEARGTRAARLALRQVLEIPRDGAPTDVQETQDRKAEQFNQVGSRVFHAALGMDPAVSLDLHELVDFGRLNRATPRQLLRLDEVVQAMPDAKAIEDVVEPLTDALLARMTDKATDPRVIANLGNALAALAGKGTRPEQIEKVAKTLLARMTDQATDPINIANLGQALAALAGKADLQEQIEKVAKTLLACMTDQATKPFVIAHLGDALAALAGKGTRPEQIEKGAEALLARMTDQATDSDDIGYLGKALVALAGKGTRPEQIEKGAEALLARMTDNATAYLGQVLAALAGKGTRPEQIEKGAKALFARMTDQATAPFVIDELGYVWAALAGKGTRPEQIEKGAEALLARMTDQATDPRVIASLGYALAALAGKGTRPEQIKQRAEALLARMTGKATHPRVIGNLGNALAALAGKGTRPEQIEKGAEALLARMTDKATKPYDIGYLGQVLATLAGKGARPEQIGKGARLVHVWLRQHPEFDMDNKPAMASLLAQVPLRDLLLTLRSPAGATNRDLLAAALSKQLKAGKDLPYWDALRLAKKTDPKLFAEVAR